MTEAEWLAAADSAPLVAHLGEPYPQRKSRLLMLAFCLLRRRSSTHAVVRDGVRALEAHYADPAAADRPFEGRRYRAVHARVERHVDRRVGGRSDFPTLGVFTATEPAPVAARRGLTPFGVTHCLEMTSVDVRGRTLPRVRAAQAGLVRDVFGNPFRPPRFCPAWRTADAVALARAIYAGRDFAALPVLADALEDAGCDAADLLAHCRGAGPHVRGCWALDLALGKG